MQLSTILSVFLFGYIFIYNDRVSCHNFEWPVRDCMAAAAIGDLAECGNKLAKQLYELHNWSKKEQDKSCGFPCTHKLRGRFVSWQWKWIAHFQCDSKAPGIVGEATRHSRDGAKEWAIKDFVQKALAAGHIDPKDVKC